MTTFNLYTGNHFPQARESLSDHLLWMRAGLEELGHTVEMINDGHDLRNTSINIMWEHFIEAFPEAFINLQNAAGKKFPFVIIVTEYFDGEGFNFHRSEGWKQRWNNFAKMAQHAEGLLTYFESDVITLGKRFNKPVALLELGYSDKLFIHKAPQTLFDFSFFGSQNAHRLSILDRLQSRGYKIYCPGEIVPREAINALITHTSINIDAKGPNRIPMPSTARVGRIIHAARGIALEYTPQQPRPSCFLKMQKENEDFIDYCEDLINSNWQEKADEVLELYKRTMPMKMCVEKALDLTIGKGMI